MANTMVEDAQGNSLLSLGPRAGFHSSARVDNGRSAICTDPTRLVARFLPRRQGCTRGIGVSH